MKFVRQATDQAFEVFAVLDAAPAGDDDPRLGYIRTVGKFGFQRFELDSLRQACFINRHRGDGAMFGDRFGGRVG